MIAFPRPCDAVSGIISRYGVIIVNSIPIWLLFHINPGVLRSTRVHIHSRSLYIIWTYDSKQCSGLIWLSYLCVNDTMIHDLHIASVQVHSFVHRVEHRTCMRGW